MNTLYDLVRAFPHELEKDVRQVLSMLNETRTTMSGSELILSGEKILIPHRVYEHEPKALRNVELSEIVEVAAME